MTRMQTSFPARKVIGSTLAVAASTIVIWVLNAFLLETPGSGTGDRIGFVRYNHESDVYLPLDYVEADAAPGSHLAALEVALSNAAVGDTGRLGPDGSTCIGCAMQTAAGMLVGQPGDRKHVMVY